MRIMSKLLLLRHNPNRLKANSCPLCSKLFYHHVSLRAHISRVHTIEKGYKLFELIRISLAKLPYRFTWLHVKMQQYPDPS